MHPVGFCSVGTRMISILLSIPTIFLVNAVGELDLSGALLESRQAPAVTAISKFLRRAYHASTVAGNWLYIDGGQFSFINNGTPQYEYSSTILSIDLSKDWTNTSLAIQSTSKPDGAPNLKWPSLWYHDSEQILYSGFAGTNSDFDGGDTPPPSLWTFKPDKTGSGTWDQIINSKSAVWSSTKQSNRGYMAVGDGSAYVLGGTDQALYSGDKFSGMIQFDMGARSFSNISAKEGATPPSGNNGYEGAMQYVPNFGPGGIFVAMGGSDDNSAIDFGSVTVFDPRGGSWYNQTTTGSKPTARVNFCTAGVASSNNTYEIFVYGGDTGSLGTASVSLDSISILTLPAFHWLSVPYNPQNPRSGLTCHAVGGSQIVTIGGIDANPKQTTGSFEDVEKSSFESPDPFSQGLAVWDMSTLSWADSYKANGPGEYNQSAPIKSYYAQTGQGYVKSLLPGVYGLMTNSHFAANSAQSNPSTTKDSGSIAPSEPSPSSTNPPQPGPSISKGTVAGAVIGSLIGASLLIAAAGYLFGRRRSSKRKQSSGAEGYDKNTKSWALEKDGHERHEAREMGGQGRVEMGNGFWPGGGHWPGGGRGHEMDGQGRGDAEAKRHELDGGHMGAGNGPLSPKKGLGWWSKRKSAAGGGGDGGYEVSGGEVARELG